MDEDQKPPLKRRRRKIQLQNGYDVLFTKDPPEHLPVECSICLCVLQEPRLIDCTCGSSFCQKCIEPALKEGNPCPLCKSPFTMTLPDRRLQRTLNNCLKVFCSFKDIGCRWRGELGMLPGHLNTTPSEGYKKVGCPYVLLDCCYCGDKFQRQFIIDHEKEKCMKRPHACTSCNAYKSTFEDVVTSHISVCPHKSVLCPNSCGESLQRKNLDDHLNTNCPLEVIKCLFSQVGCETKLPRKEMASHLVKNSAVHMTLQAASHQRQIEQLESRILKLEKEARVKNDESLLRTHLKIMPTTIVMNGFSEKKAMTCMWRSECFYTHPRGYKMFLSVIVNGGVEVDGSHMSVFIHLLPGEFDYKLKWPFRGTVVVDLLDQDDNEKVYSQVMDFTQANKEGCCKVTKGDFGSGWGFPEFISQKKLSSNYLKDDTLYFKLSYRAEIICV